MKITRESSRPHSGLKDSPAYRDLDIPDVETFKSTASPDVLASLRRLRQDYHMLMISSRR